MQAYFDYMESPHRIFGIIPARYESSRFPGKPLAKIADKTLIQTVYDNVSKTIVDNLVVATDDKRIFDHVSDFGGNVVMTNKNHPSGTDRCREAADWFNSDDDDIVINIQGDEPLISNREIQLLASAFNTPNTQIATLANLVEDNAVLNNPNKVKIVTDINNFALYFSRAPIPFQRDKSSSQPQILIHVGIYAFRFKTLKAITQLPICDLENCEKLEQLRWLYNGFHIKVIPCNYNGFGIDTPEDLDFFINNLS